MPIHNYIEECIIVLATLRIIESTGLSKNTESIPKKKKSRWDKARNHRSGCKQQHKKKEKGI